MGKKHFNFDKYEFSAENKQADFHYSYTDEQGNTLCSFIETLKFPQEISQNIPVITLQKTLELVHIMLGLGYYKMYCPKEISHPYEFTKEQAEFFNTVYTEGLGEFWYTNQIDPTDHINFSYSENLPSAVPEKLQFSQNYLIGVGGGKDSIVAFELLKRSNLQQMGFIIQTQKRSELKYNVLKEMGIDALTIERYLDEQLFNQPEDALNGHVPISAIWSTIALLSGLLYRYNAFIVANEHSSSFGNIEWKGLEVNHQWSKSQRYENLIQNYIHSFITPDFDYISLLRPLNEIRIAKEFTQFKNYFPLFSSCNRNFKAFKERTQTQWCSECPKCHFVFLMLAAFLEPAELTQMFGKNLLDQPENKQAYKDLLGFGDMKPFECVGTFEESQAALFLASEKFSNSIIVQKLLPLITDGEKIVERVMEIQDAPNLPDNLKLLTVNNVALLGYGTEGQLTHKYLEKRYPHLEVNILDQKDDKNYLEKQNDFDFIIKTPGIAKEKVTIPHTTATNLFLSELKNNPTITTIGITGTKGKSTTASLIHHIFQTAGLQSEIIGNIGTPMLSSIMNGISENTIYVIELSSYMLDDINHAPDIAVALNLYPEHLNYHGNLENYSQAKSNITLQQNSLQTFIYNENFNELKKWASESSAQKISYLQPETPYQTSLQGTHNQENIAAAIEVTKQFNIDQEIINHALQSFQPLSYRLENIGTFNDITFINDANASTPEATIAALEAFPDTETIFLGGLDRGYDFSELQKVISESSIKNIVLFPDSGKTILGKLFTSEKFNILETESMQQAVEFAYKNTSSEKICLLSCASPSYSLWKNFEEKGDEFNHWVNKLS